jgi:hypothetical protein
VADTTTTNYAFVKPEVGASSDTWGTKLNADLDAIDTAIKAASDAAVAAAASVAARIPLAGSLAITGNLGFRKDNPLVQFFSPDGSRGYDLYAGVTNAATSDLLVRSQAAATLLALTPQGDMAVTRRLGAAGTIRSTAISDFSSGSGAELYFDAGAGVLNAYNRGTPAFLPLRLYGLPVEFYHNGTKRLETTTGGVLVAGTVTDTTGDVRRPGSRLLNSTGNVVAGDMNAIVEKSTAGAVSATLVTGLGARGDIVTFVNSSTSGNLTIARSGTTLYQNGANADIVVPPGSLASIVRADTANVWVG